MQKKCNKKLLSLILSMMLIVAMAFHMTACGDNTNKENPVGTEGQSQTDGVEGDAQSNADNQAEGNVLGQGNTVFTFVVVDAEGNEKNYEIHTDKATVGEALLEVGLIAGEDGDYGLYVKTVDGITLDYDKDGKYWAFYIDGEMAMSGVDSTPVTAGTTYSFKAE